MSVVLHASRKVEGDELMADVFGIPIKDPPDGWVCLEALVLGKAVNTRGRVVMFIRTTEGLTSVDTLGMLAAANRTIGDDVAESFADDGDDEDDDEEGE